MKAKRRTNKAVTTVLTAVLAIGFLCFFLLPPSPLPASGIERTYRPSRRNSGGIITRFDLRNITATAHAWQNRERVLVLTPIARWYDEYWKNLMTLTYPRELIDLGFIIPKGLEGDQVLENLKVRLKEVQGRSGAGGKFNHVTILRQDVEVPIMSQDEKGLPVTQTDSNL
jgi:mannan polymerase complexes MNN9 subunit